jgi:restriction endonuclease S subunit
MSYEIQSQKLDKNKVFILQKSELEKRFDPQWYVYLKSISGFKHKTTTLKTLLKENPQYGANEIGIDRTSNEQPRYIRITDINEFGELFNEFGKTANNAESKYFLSENDLLIARSGNTVGKSYLHKKTDYEAFFAGYMIRFKLDETKVLPEYVFVYTQTDLYKRWTKAIQRTTGQPNINAEEYKSLEIPLPDFSTQEKIVDIYFKFLESKKQNELEAEKLLSSIDDYLLKALGIELPKTPGNTLQNRIFTTSIKDISGGRFDPFYNISYFKGVSNSFSESNFPFVKIKNVLTNIKTGTTPHQKLEPFVENDGIVFLRNTNLKKYYIDLSDTKYVKTEFQNELTYSVKDEVIMCIAGTVGISAVNDIHFPISINQNVSALKFNDDKIVPEFASYWFNTKLFLELTKRACSVATILYLNNDNLKDLPIPIPPIEKQKEIANHITKIRNQARQLTDKTNEGMKKASEEIERILLQ